MSSSKIPVEKFHFGWQHLFRIVIFIVIYFLLINFLSTTSSPVIPNANLVLPDVTQMLPQESRQQLSQVSRHPVVTFVQDKIGLLNQQLQDFPQSQIKQFQLWLVKSVSNQLINNLENNVTR